MPAPDIILSKGQMLITQAASVLNIIPINPNINFGTVALVYETCDKVAVGASVMYDNTKTSQLMYGSTVYLLIDEQYVSGAEVPVP